MISIRAAALLLCLALLSPVQALAQTPPDSVHLMDGRTLSGQVVSFDGNTLVLRTNDGTQTFDRRRLSAIHIAHGGGGGLPPGISVGEGLQVVRWTTFRQITNYQRGPDNKSIHSLKISGNGSKIIYGAAQGTFTLNADGSGLVRVGDAPDLGLVDISADGRRIAWYARMEGLMTASVDGSGKAKLPATNDPPKALRLTAAGDRVFVIVPSHGDVGGVYEMAADGNNMRRVFTTTQAAAALGSNDANGNFWANVPDNFDMSDDGRRGVVRFLHETIAFSTDRSSPPMKLVGLPYQGTYGGAARISGNGQKIAYRLTVGNEQSFNLVNFDGSGRVQYQGEFAVGYWPQVSPDGSSALLSSGLRFFDGNTQSFKDIDSPGHHTGALLFEGPIMASLAADWKRGVILIDGVMSVDQGLPSQLVAFELNPAQLGDAPTVTDVTASPRFVSTDGSTALNVKLNSSATDPKQQGAVFFREQMRPTHIGLERGFHPAFNRAPDGSYTNDFRLTSGWGDPGAGPLVLRIYFQNKNGRTTIVDVAGIEARKL